MPDRPFYPSGHFQDSWMPDWRDFPEAVSLEERLDEQDRVANSKAVLDATKLSSAHEPATPNVPPPEGG